jgi:hypothetical protein
MIYNAPGEKDLYELTISRVNLANEEAKTDMVVILFWKSK